MSEENSTSNEGGQNPYLMLGLTPGASFEEIQQARDERLSEIGDDPILKAKIEASFDALLMNSLKERQLGKVSNEAVNASKRENSINEIGGNKLITQLTNLPFLSKEKTDQSILPSLNIPEGQDLITRISLAILGIILVLVSPDESTQLILSLSTIILLVGYVKSGKGILKSLGWSVVFLSIGLIVGGIIVSGMGNIPNQMHIFTPNKVQGIVSVLIIWIGSLF